TNPINTVPFFLDSPPLRMTTETRSFDASFLCQLLRLDKVIWKVPVSCAKSFWVSTVRTSPSIKSPCFSGFERATSSPCSVEKETIHSGLYLLPVILVINDYPPHLDCKHTLSLEHQKTHLQ